MAPPTTTPKLRDLVPATVAREVAQSALDHLASLHPRLIGGADLPSQPEPELTEIYRTVRMLAGYARGDHKLDAPVHEYLIGLIPLWSAVCGQVPDVDGLVESEPETALGVVIAAALAREQLARGVEPLTAPQVAVLAGVHRDHVRLLASRGEVPGAYREEGSRGLEWRFEARAKLRKWLEARG